MLRSQFPIPDPTRRILDLCRSHVKNTLSVDLSSRLISDLQMDSLDRVGFIMDIEDAYSISIPDSKLDDLLTVEDVVDYVKAAKWWT